MSFAVLAPDDAFSFAVLATLPFLLCDARGFDLLLLEAADRDLVACFARPLDRDAPFDEELDGLPFVRFDELLRFAEPELADDLRPLLAFVWGILYPSFPFCTTSWRGVTHLAED